MKIPVLLALIVPLVFGCTGKVIVEHEGRGGGGSGGSSGSGGFGPCSQAECIGDNQDCSCHTTCPGPKLRADCQQKDDDVFICECHYDGQYMGTCGLVGGPACSLPGGCCPDFL